MVLGVQDPTVGGAESNLQVTPDPWTLKVWPPCSLRGLITQGVPWYFQASVGCKWSSRRTRDPGEMLELGLDLGHHLPLVLIFFLWLLELSLSWHSCHPAILSSFSMVADLLSMVGIGSFQFFAHVFGHLLYRLQFWYVNFLLLHMENFFSNF